MIVNLFSLLLGGRWPSRWSAATDAWDPFAEAGPAGPWPLAAADIPGPDPVDRAAAGWR